MSEENLNENQQTADAEAANADIDFVMGGPETDHSPDSGVEIADAVPASGPEQQEAPAKTDSADAEAKDAEITRELETLNKRLHDTQAAYHAETQKRAGLEKELADLKAKADDDDIDDDDWFGDETANDRDTDETDEHRLEVAVAEAKSKVESLEAEAADINQRAAEAIWDREANKVIADHPDFEKVVYGELYSAIQPDGDAFIREAWAKNTDKSPRGAYDFAMKMREISEIQRDPKAYREKMKAEVRSEMGLDNGSLLGAEGLGMLNSQDGEVYDSSDTGNDDIDFVLRR